ncbi:MAG: sortase, partial [Clostridium sp.]|nr:sortase [Clostridium sp.]
VKIEEKQDIKIENNDILGYIEIPKISLKKTIKVGNVEKILNQKYVAIIEGKTSQSKNLVLAGHNIESVFKNIRSLEINDNILIYIENEMRYYKVGNIKTIEVDDTQYLRETKEQTLTLITCTDNNTKRLLVICYRI